jgi:hypothetical protein
VLRTERVRTRTWSAWPEALRARKASAISLPMLPAPIIAKFLKPDMFVLIQMLGRILDFMAAHSRSFILDDEE